MYICITHSSTFKYSDFCGFSRFSHHGTELSRVFFQHDVREGFPVPGKDPAEPSGTRQDPSAAAPKRPAAPEMPHGFKRIKADPDTIDIDPDDSADLDDDDVDLDDEESFDQE
jgi:hypothetical protein